MASPLRVDDAIRCPHGGRVRVAPVPGARVLVSGVPVLTASAVSVVGDCPALAQGQIPCLTVNWWGVVSRVRVNGAAMVTDRTPGMLVPSGALTRATAAPSRVRMG